MNVDPLQDSAPPRYLYESDDEDEWDPTSQSKAVDQPASIDIRISPQFAHGRSLVVASGRVGQYWGRGANLGEQKGAVNVNGIQVGLLFEPKWTDSVVLVSEAGTSLPIWAMHSYAETVLNTLRPLRLSLLDSYPLSTYITSDPIQPHEAPVRYLTTGDWTPGITDIHPFLSPNILQSTSASLLSIASLPYHGVPTTLILVPSSHSAQLPPTTLGSNDIDALTGVNSDLDWSTERVHSAGQALFYAAGETKNRAEWQAPEGKDRRPRIPKRGGVGDGGLYI